MTMARVVMTVATACLTGERDEWAQAMQAEFIAIEDNRRPLTFALGCLVAAWRELPLHGSGRFLLSRYGLAVGVLLPFATFHLGCSAGAIRFLITGRDPHVAMLAMGNEHQRQIAAEYIAVAPLFMTLLLALGLSHLVVAWEVAACHWRRAWMAAGVAALSAVALVGLIVAIEPSGRGIAIQLAALAVELAAVPALRAWQMAIDGRPRAADAA